MSDDFKEKLKLYKDGRLNSGEAVAIENEIEKYTAIKDYLNDIDDEFVAELKQQLDTKVPGESAVGKKINRKMIVKIISLSLVTIIACLLIIPSLYITGASILGKAYRVDTERFVQEENFTGQFLHMVSPQVNYTGGRDHTEFYRQTFICNFVKGIGRKAPLMAVEVNYSMGKLKKLEREDLDPLNYFPADSFYAINPQTYFNTSEWGYLENAPQGTNAQIFIAFKSKLSPGQARKALGEEYFAPEKSFTIDMLADIGSEITVANAYTSAANDSRNNEIPSKQEELDYFKKFNAYDNELHKQMLLFGLNRIKNHKNIADYITLNYLSQGDSLFSDIDEMISYVDKNGVQYVGAMISGDTKELLKLKNNPNIYACRVEDIVVW